MHVTVGTLFLAFCWARHFLASILPADIEKGLAPAALVKTLVLLGYEPAKGRI